MSISGEDPRAIANIILLCGEEEGMSFSNLAVQKLLYFCHASFLATYRRPLVNGVFEAWAHGPVCRIVYDELKHYGRSKITEKIVKRDIFSNAVIPIELPNSRRVNSHIYSVVSRLGKLSTGQLVKLSHIEGGAWDFVWNKRETPVTLGNRIEDSLIREKFSMLKLPLQLNENNCESDWYEATPFAGD